MTETEEHINTGSCRSTWQRITAPDWDQSSSAARATHEPQTLPAQSRLIRAPGAALPSSSLEMMLSTFRSPSAIFLQSFPRLRCSISCFRVDSDSYWWNRLLDSVRHSVYMIRIIQYCSRYYSRNYFSPPTWSIRFPLLKQHTFSICPN